MENGKHMGYGKHMEMYMSGQRNEHMRCSLVSKDLGHKNYMLVHLQIYG